MRVCGEDFCVDEVIALGSLWNVEVLNQGFDWEITGGGYLPEFPF